MEVQTAFNSRSWFGGSGPSAPRPISNADNRRMLRARFDSAQTTRENYRHWQMADAASADSSADPGVRRVLRMRCRYEFHNNSYFMGTADTLANYTIGTGPRLQMLTGNKSLNAGIEKEWERWAKEICLADTLKVMRLARTYNGESFALMRTNPDLDHPVKLDVHQVEADQVTRPLLGLTAWQFTNEFDGVTLDPFGRPKSYYVLRQHPGAFGVMMTLPWVGDEWSSKFVLHDFKRLRPGQQRGIPEFVPGLPLFAQLRRYALAVLGAAETAADHATVLETDAPAGEGIEGDPFDTVTLDRNMTTVLPGGYKLSGFKPEQPTTAYAEYTNAVLTELARCLNVPLFFVTLDARLANMASAYIVTQPFARAVQIDRAGYDAKLDRLLDAWLTEAIRIPGLLPRDLPNEFPRTWRWPRIGQHADPSKVASAQETQLGAGTSSIPLLCAEDGHDWEEVQVSAAKSYGMTLDEYRAALRQKAFATAGMPDPASLAPEPPDPNDEPGPPASDRTPVPMTEVDDADEE